MAVFRLSTAARNAAVAAVASLLDAGSGVGTIQIRDGSMPATPNDAAAGTLLATVSLNDPAFGSPSSGSAALATGTVPSGTGVAAGTATWFRALDSAGNAVCDGDVTATGGGGSLTLANAAITVGLEVRVTGGTITQPVG